MNKTKLEKAGVILHAEGNGLAHRQISRKLEPY